MQHTTVQLLRSIYGEYLVDAESGYDISVQFDYGSLPDNRGMCMDVVWMWATECYMQLLLLLLSLSLSTPNTPPFLSPTPPFSLSLSSPHPYPHFSLLTEEWATKVALLKRNCFAAVFEEYFDLQQKGGQQKTAVIHYRDQETM